MGWGGSEEGMDQLLKENLPKSPPAPLCKGGLGGFQLWVANRHGFE